MIMIITYEIGNRIFWGVHPKIDDDTYVWSTTKIYSYFSFVFSIVPKIVTLLKIE